MFLGMLSTRSPVPTVLTFLRHGFMKSEMKEKTNIARRLCMYVPFVKQIRFRRGNGKKCHFKCDFTIVFRNCLLSSVIANLLCKFLS